jgi:tight adherence protein C
MTQERLGTLINLLMLLTLLGTVFGWWMVRYGGRRGRIAQRARAVAFNRSVSGVPPDADADRTLIGRMLPRLAAMGDRVPWFDARHRLHLRQQMIRAGYRSRNAASVLLGAKLFVGLVGAVMMLMFGARVPAVGQYLAVRGAMMLAAFMMGLIFPEYVIAFLSKRRSKVIGSCFPDALDLLVICTNAGNSLAVAIRRVADEMVTICPPLASEFSLTADELKISGDTTRALLGLVERVDLPAMRALVSALTQSMRYGTPITQALRTLSRSERLSHMVALEEQAAKLAPKMVVPMILFVLPAVCAIAAGPAVIQLLAVMRR